MNSQSRDASADMDTPFNFPNATLAMMSNIAITIARSVVASVESTP